MKRILIFLLLFLAVIASTIVVIHTRRPAIQRDKVTLAVAVSPLSAPVYIAAEKGFFRQEGLEVELRSFAVGKAALDSLIAGQADFCTVAEMPLVFAGFKSEKIYIVATIAEANNYVKLIGRKDRGIFSPHDLKGKTVAVPKGTASEYFLSIYLTFNEIDAASVHMVDMKIEETGDALAKGTVDAAVSRPPYLLFHQKRLGKNGTVLSNEHLYTLQHCLVGRQDFITQNPKAVEKLLRALMKGSDYIQRSREDAQRILIARVGHETAELNNYSFNVGLYQTMLFNMEGQARWAIREGLTDKKEVPDFLPMVYTKGLDAVRPENNRLIHK